MVTTALARQRHRHHRHRRHRRRHTHRHRELTRCRRVNSCMLEVPFGRRMGNMNWCCKLPTVTLSDMTAIEGAFFGLRGQQGAAASAYLYKEMAIAFFTQDRVPHCGRQARIKQAAAPDWSCKTIGTLFCTRGLGKQCGPRALEGKIAALTIPASGTKTVTVAGTGLVTIVRGRTMETHCRRTAGWILRKIAARPVTRKQMMLASSMRTATVAGTGLVTIARGRITETH